MVFDCPPALGHVVVAALAAADEVLIPVAAHVMELQVDDDLADQVRNAVMWLHKVDVYTTISAIAEVFDAGSQSNSSEGGNPRTLPGSNSLAPRPAPRTSAI